MSKNPLTENAYWHNYNGEDLSINRYVHIFKIDVSFVFPFINPESILSFEELKKAGRFFQQTDKESFIVGKYCLRLLLSKFISLSPSQIEYSYTKNKKPYISSSIYFSLSRHKNHVLIAISSQDIGIDVEQHVEDFDFTPILKSCFSEEEISFIYQGPQPSLNFYTLWTRKEALLKATGEGIINNLSEISCLYNIQSRVENQYQLDTWLSPDNAIISLARPIYSNPVKHWSFSPVSIYA